MILFVYNVFLCAYRVAFNVAALFNAKAKAGLNGRRNIFLSIKASLKSKQAITNTNSQQVIWMHCASLGEFEQGRPVLENLKKYFPSSTLVLTFFSASGYAAIKNYKGADHIFYLPFDSRVNAKKMIRLIKPSLVLWVKYEYWFYYLDEFRKQQIPVLLVSGIFRTGQPFFKWYGLLWKKMLACFHHLFVQNDASAELLLTVSIHQNVTVSGDTRFDRVIEIANDFTEIPLIEKFCKGKKVIVAGSTWDEDEKVLLHYVKSNPQIQFIIAPHEITVGNIEDVRAEFTNAVLYSNLAEIYNSEAISLSVTMPNVLIIDNIGMLSQLYKYADIAYVGGGFGSDGVHNILEAAVYGNPVIFGPVFKKYDEAVNLLASGGGISISNALELEALINSLLQNEQLLSEKGKAARDFVYNRQGASKKIISYIQEKRLLTN